MWWRWLAEVQTENQKGDLSDFERGTVVGALNVEGFTENGLKKRKHGSCVKENALLMSEVRGEWADWLEMIERQQ